MSKEIDLSQLDAQIGVLEDLAQLCEEEKGSEDEPSGYARGNMESMPRAVVENGLPRPSLCSFQDAVIGEWLRKGYTRIVRLHCAGAPHERSYIYWCDENGSGIEDLNTTALIRRLQWFAECDG